MQPFDVTYPRIADERLSDLLAATNQAGFPTPTITPTAKSGATSGGAVATSTLNLGPELPDDWRAVRELVDQSFPWPNLEEPERYLHYAIYAGTAREGTVHIALGEAERMETWGKDRKYFIAFLTSGSPQLPLVEFLETDDYAETHEVIAVIRGRGGHNSKKMYGPADPLPEVYTEHFRIGIYSDYIRVPGAWGKLAVIADEDGVTTILNHALLQARRKGSL
jgi:hypothetical protein